MNNENNLFIISSYHVLYCFVLLLNGYKNTDNSQKS